MFYQQADFGLGRPGDELLSCQSQALLNRKALHNFRKMPPISPSCHQILVDTSADKEELAKFCHGSFSSC